MKQLTLGIFDAREDAEKAVNALHHDLGIANEDISYIYRSEDGKVKSVEPGDVSASTPAEGAATGAWTGGALGAIAGIATVAGVIPVIGPVFAAGPLVAALGISAGAVGTTAAGAATGAAAGGFIGALVSWGASEEHAQKYADHVRAGNILVAAHSEDAGKAVQALTKAGATEINTYTTTV